MDHIPVEILHHIFIQLELKDRLECMLVCRFWYDTLDGRSLLHSLYIPSGRFHRVKDMLERLSYRNTQVERLIIDVDSDFDKRKLCNMFPNLQQLDLQQGNMERIRPQNYLNTKFYFIYPATKLERISDCGHCELAGQLAMSNLCGLVNFLELDFSSLSKSAATNIMSQLKNMPVLETLRLVQMQVNLMDLEILHNNLGSIKYLDLDSITLCSGDVPHEFKPATLITKLAYYIENADDLNTHIQFYRYIHRKYPSVSNLERNDFVLETENEDYAREVYTKGIIPLYQNIGSQIDSFCFEACCNGLDAFRKFDEYGFKLKNLAIKSSDEDGDVFFLDELVQSNQARYIQHLELDNTVPAPLSQLIGMEALQTLKINFYDHRPSFQYRNKKTINFSQFIEACPATLSELYIDDVGFTFNGSPLKPNFINHLQLDFMELTRDLAKAIETNFPKLSSLKLVCVLRSNLTISLPNHHLSRVDISTKYTEGRRNGFFIKTTNDNKIQHYMQREIQNRGSFGSEYQVIPVTGEEFDVSLVLNFTCASVKKLILAVH